MNSVTQAGVNPLQAPLQAADMEKFVLRYEKVQRELDAVNQLHGKLLAAKTTLKGHAVALEKAHKRELKALKEEGALLEEQYLQLDHRLGIAAAFDSERVMVIRQVEGARLQHSGVPKEICLEMRDNDPQKKDIWRRYIERAFSEDIKRQADHKVWRESSKSLLKSPPSMRAKIPPASFKASELASLKDAVQGLEEGWRHYQQANLLLVQRISQFQNQHPFLAGTAPSDLVGLQGVVSDLQYEFEQITQANDTLIAKIQSHKAKSEKLINKHMEKKERLNQHNEFLQKEIDRWTKVPLNGRSGLEMIDDMLEKNLKIKKLLFSKTKMI